MEMNNASKPPTGYSVLSMRGGQLLSHTVDNPFIYSVIGTPREEGGYSTEWWVTGPQGPDSRTDPVGDRPILLLQLSVRIGCTKSAFEATVQQIWRESVEALAYVSAISGGIVDSLMWKRLSDGLQKDITIKHLMGHDYLDHFSKSNKTVRAAMMYQLLRDMGVSTIQQSLASFERFSFSGYELLEKESTVTAVTINQRLTHAKKLGLLPSGPAKSGRKPHVASQSKVFLEKNPERDIQGLAVKSQSTPSPYLEEFASNQNQETGKEGANHEHKEK